MGRKYLVLLLCLVMILPGCQLFTRQPEPEPQGQIVDLTPQWNEMDQALRRGLDAVDVPYTTDEERLVVAVYPLVNAELHSPARPLTANYNEPVSLDRVLALIKSSLEDVGGFLAGIESIEEGENQLVSMDVGYNYDQFEPVTFIRTHQLRLRYTAPPTSSLPQAPAGEILGTIAIVIDDFGYGGPGTQEILALNVPITAAVLPHTPYSVSISRQAAQQGHEVILHQPMEAMDPNANPGDGAIYVNTPLSEIEQIIAQNLEHVPGAVGVNNHMGSRATSNESIMTAVLLAVQQTDLYFVDSFTTAESVVGRVAQRLGVPSATNRLFLDNIRDKETIKEEIRELARLSFNLGPIIGIGHVHQSMADALQEMVPELQQAGVKIVPASQIIQGRSR